MESVIDYKALGARIRRARKERGITQERLGELCAISTAHMGHIERGTRIPSLDVFYRIVTALGISADELLIDSPKSYDAALAAIARSLDGKDRAKVKTFIGAVKALAENVDDL